MNNTSPLPQRLKDAFRPSPRGVVGLVEDLLELCREEGLQLSWHTNQCRVRSLGNGAQESVEFPLQKSVFRAILARMAALCNEQALHSVSPYGGESELSIGTNPPAIFRVAFTNTASEQRLELRRRKDDKDDAREFTILLRASAASDEPTHVVKVRGYRLKRVPPQGESDKSWVGILAAPGEKDVYTALFPGGEVIAAFCGEVRLTGKEA